MLIEGLRQAFNFRFYLANFIALPFFATKYHRRYLATWHVIPLFVLACPTALISFFYGETGEALLLLLTVSLLRQLVFVGPVSLLGFCVTSIAFRSARFRQKQQVNAAVPVRSLTTLVAIRYFAVAELVEMAILRLVTTFQGHGASFVGWLSLGALIAMPIIYYWSGRQLQKLRKASQRLPSSERPFLRSDYIYLFIPIGISAGAAFMLILIGKYP